MATPRESLAAQAPALPVRRGKRDPLEGLAEEAIATFAKPLDEPPETEVNIRNVAFRGSYSWLEADEPTIAVPGSPRVWKNRPLPYTVPADSGRSFIDQNGFRIPSCPMLPLFVAVDTLEARSEQPKLEWETLDFITDRNNLLKLAGFILPKLSNKKKFRIDLEFVGSRTIIMQRWEESNVVWSHGNGYGDSFERETTTPGPGCEQSSLAGHTRITSYDFSGLKMLVRCEVDACYPSGDSEDEDKLVEALSALDVNDEPSTSSNTTLTTVLNLHVVHAGRVVPQPALIKLKTRSSSTYHGFSWDGPYVQLLLGQTPTLIVGLHKNGTFEKLHERELDTSAYENARQRTEPALKKLRRLLEDIHTAVLKHGRGAKLSIVTDSGILKLVERTDDKVLPDEVVRRFDV